MQPHGALLKGELIENIIIRNKASQSSKSGVYVGVYGNTTVWEFKKEVANLLDLAPQYLKLTRSNGKEIKNIENGKVVSELGIKNGDLLNAFKINTDEDVPHAALIMNDGTLNPKLVTILNEIFDLYTNEEGLMTRETCTDFIRGCTGDKPPVTDDRVLFFFKTYDSDGDDKITRDDFLQFYTASSRSKPETVKDNLKAHNIRADLKKLSEVKEELEFSQQ